MRIELETTNEDYILVNGHRIYMNEQLRVPVLQEYQASILPDNTSTKESSKEKETAISQFASISKLPGLVEAIGLPDFHMGYALPIGSIAVIDISHPEACVSPDGVGFDINCGVRCLKTNLTIKDLTNDRRSELAELLVKEMPFKQENIPTSTESIQHLNSILDRGMEYLFEVGLVTKDDIENTESRGVLPGNSKLVSQAAKARGIQQLGSLGSGNHYLEIPVVESIFNKEIAAKMGIIRDQILVSIHTGSRGLGHGCCTDILKEISALSAQATAKSNLKSEFKVISKNELLTRKEKSIEYDRIKKQMKESKLPVEKRDSLEYIPYNSEIGQKYISIMSSASNFAWANRSIITNKTRACFSKLFPESKLEMVYDVCHNVAKIENVNGKQVLVHRKGASRVLPPNHPELSEKCIEVGQPVLVGGSMGTSSYLIVGAPECIKTYFSTCHGAGRIVSRSQSKKLFDYESIVEDMKNKGIAFKAGTREGMIEECCGCYKDVDVVVEHSEKIGVTTTVCRVKPLLVIKG